MIVLDASVLIAQLDKGDIHHHRAIRLLEESGTEPLGASPITLAEVLVMPHRAGVLAQANAVLHDLGIRAIDFMYDAPVRLAQLRAETNLKLPDCCVLLATEQTYGCVATFDLRLARAARELEMDVLGLPD